jgi:hypothetical protein
MDTTRCANVGGYSAAAAIRSSLRRAAALRLPIERDFELALPQRPAAQCAEKRRNAPLAQPDILSNWKANAQMDHTTQKRFFFPGSSEFVVSDRFTVGFDPVQISYLGANFKEIFLDLVVAPQPAGFYSAMNLTERLTGPQIVEQFGAEHMATLPVAWHLLMLQSSSEPGALYTSGLTNILIPPGSDYSVGIFWFRGAWSIRAYPFQSDNPRRWFAGNQVIVRID